MNKNIITIGLCLAVLFQLSVLVGEFVSASIPLWTGKEIRVKTLPVDPRSMFRGNYARLNYEFSQIETQDLKSEFGLRNGEVVYVSLKSEKDNLYNYDSISLDKPSSGLFIRGRISNRNFVNSNYHLQIKYGIEAYFVKKEKALELEKNLGNGGVAVIMVSNSGKCALKDVIPNIE